ncbi:bifunctional alpha/beta hydrolase/OsmC family protein [Pelomicrobium sp.]|uniref:bifunctional alpha/beta hydrolase/OsmC family protein n=1 Tax=Pelomicrobium sp. TaxID=2815319 RepID=UPI002FDC9436
MQPIYFPGALGAPLAARLDLPVGEVIAYALFAHCFTCSKDSLAAAQVSAELKAQGIAVLRFDFTGLGGSEGDFANTGFSSNVADVVAAAAYLRREHEAPRLLVGHSLGGAAVLAAARNIPEAVGVVTIGAPAEPAHVARLLAPGRAEVEARGEAEVEIAGRRFRIRRQFLDELARADILGSLGQLRKALLIMHSPRDTVVDIENAARLFLAAKHPKSFVSLDDADHLLTHREDAVYVARVLAAWASRYLKRRKSGQEVSPACPEGVVRVEEVGSGKYAQTICAGHHRLRSDEPLTYGGSDTGPSPYQLLLASLGACTSMTLRMYAEQKGWPLERVAVELRHEKIHAADCETCETKEGKVDRIERVIELVGPLDEAQRQRLLEIANKCPVHRTLHSEVIIPTRLK